MILEFQTLQKRFRELLLKYGFPPLQAMQIADIIAETTIEGVFSHGINRFPRFIGDVTDGTVKLGVEPELIKSFSALRKIFCHSQSADSLYYYKWIRKCR